MESAPIELLAAARQHLGLDVRHGPEQRRIELHLPARLDEGELGDAGVEGELDALEQDGMVDAALQPLPAQDSVAQHQLDVLGLALDPAVELVELLEGLHRGARWTLGAGPGLVLGAPALVRFDAAGLRIEPDGLGAGVPLRLHQHDLAVGVLPVALQPVGDGQRRLRGLGERRPADLEDEVVLFGVLSVEQPALDGRVVGQVAKPERPGLLGQVPLGRVAVLVERLEVAEHARDPLAANP